MEGRPEGKGLGDIPRNHKRKVMQRTRIQGVKLFSTQNSRVSKKFYMEHNIYTI